MRDIDDFDEFLRSRFIPEPRSHLEQRIISSAMQAKRNVSAEGTSFLQRFRAVFSDFFEDILLPAPVFSLALILFAGFYVGGAYSPEVADVVEISSVSSGLDEDVYTYFEIADNLDYGEFSGI